MTYKPLMLAGAVMVALAGCYETADVTRYEPGVYKGAEDPLAGEPGAMERDTQLRDRAQTAHTDR